MVNDHNSQGETRPDRQQTHLFGGRLLVGIPVLPALPRQVVPVRRRPRHVQAPVVLEAPVGPAVQDVLPARVAPVRMVVPVRLADRRRPRSKHRRNALVRFRPAGRLAPADPALVALVAPEVPAVLAAAVPVGRVAPAVDSRPGSPRISHPHRRPPRRRPPQRRADAAAR